MSATTGVDVKEVTISVGPVLLQRMLRSPPGCCSQVLFAHGSGRGRFTLRNIYISEVLHRVRLALCSSTC
jgi:hypothetical protein